MVKRFTVGLICGAIFSISTIASASSGIKVDLFPAKFLFNNESKEITSEYKVFNYQGYSYVPIRYLAENMKSYIHYNSKDKVIEVQYLDPSKAIFSDWQGYFPNVKVGNLKYTPKGGTTEITGSYTVFNDESKNTIAFSLSFFDKKGKEIGRISSGGDISSGEVKNFSATLTGIVEENTEVKMELGIFNHVIKRN